MKLELTLTKREALAFLHSERRMPYPSQSLRMADFKIRGAILKGELKTADAAGVSAPTRGDVA
jgi:hypothetical protein